jgi:hypothetical protein
VCADHYLPCASGPESAIIQRVRARFDELVMELIEGTELVPVCTDVSLLANDHAGQTHMDAMRKTNKVTISLVPLSSLSFSLPLTLSLFSSLYSHPGMNLITAIVFALGFCVGGVYHTGQRGRSSYPNDVRGL